MKPTGRYKMGTISKLTGLSPEVLRAWERRHGFLEPERGDGGHRLYTEDDLAVLRRVVALLAKGHSIGEIALRGRRGLLADAGADPIDPRSEHAGETVDAWVEAIAAGAMALDGPAIERTLDAAFAALSPDEALAQVLTPAAHRVGDLWEAGRCSVAGEHLMSAVAIRRARALLASVGSPTPGVPHAVVACFPDELHELGGLIVAWQLARAGARVTWLGAALPFSDVGRSLRLLDADAAYLSVTRRETYDLSRDGLRALAVETTGGRRLVVGGQGAPLHDRAIEQAGVTLWPNERPVAELATELLRLRRLPTAPDTRRSTDG